MASNNCWKFFFFVFVCLHFTVFLLLSNFIPYYHLFISLRPSILYVTSTKHSLQKNGQLYFRHPAMQFLSILWTCCLEKYWNKNSMNFIFLNIWPGFTSINVILDESRENGDGNFSNNKMARKETQHSLSDSDGQLSGNKISQRFISEKQEQAVSTRRDFPLPASESLWSVLLLRRWLQRPHINRCSQPRHQIARQLPKYHHKDRVVKLFGETVHFIRFFFFHLRCWRTGPS